MQDNNIYVEEQEEITNYSEDQLRDLLQKINNREISLSFSSISNFMKSPRHFIHYKLKERKVTPAMIEGRLIDALITEPDEVASEFLVLPAGCSFASHDGLTAYCEALGIADMRDEKVADRKAYVRDHLEQLDQDVVTQDNYDKCYRIASAVVNNDAMRYILDLTTHTQKDVEFEAYGWKWRGKIDLHAQDTFNADLKLTVDAAYRKFSRQIEWMEYLTQCAIYDHGTGKKLPFYFAGYDRAGHCSVIEVKRGQIEQAWERLGTVMEYFEKCIQNNEWTKSYDFWAGYSGIYTL